MIKHIKGDILSSDTDIIIHQVNCQGAMDSGIAKQIREKYPMAYENYKHLCKYYKPEELLGYVQYVAVGDNKIVCNVFGQLNYGYNGELYTNYEALGKAFKYIAKHSKNRSIAIPYNIGCCRGGGDWVIVYNIINEVFKDCDVTLYEYNGG